MTREAPHDISPGLLRQRRNLFLASLIALFVFLTHAEIDPVATLAGTRISIGRPEMLPWFLLVAQIYYLLRYWQYLWQEGDLGIADTFFHQLRGYTMNDLMRSKNVKYPDGARYGADFDFRRLKDRRGWKGKFIVPASSDEFGKATEGELEVDFRRYRLEMLRAAVAVVFTTSYVTDYVFPVIVAVLGIAANIALLDL